MENYSTACWVCQRTPFGDSGQMQLVLITCNAPAIWPGAGDPNSIRPPHPPAISGRRCGARDGRSFFAPHR